MKKPIITKEQILQLRAQGYSISQMTEILKCSKSKITYILADKHIRGEIEVSCNICQTKFIHQSGGSRPKICKDPKCKSEWEAIKRQKRKEKQAEEEAGKYRPFSHTANMMIVKLLDGGVSISEIAAIQGRDLETLKKHIEIISTNGTADKIRATLKSYKEDMPSVGVSRF